MNSIIRAVWGRGGRAVEEVKKSKILNSIVGSVVELLEEGEQEQEVGNVAWLILRVDV